MRRYRNQNQRKVDANVSWSGHFGKESDRWLFKRLNMERQEPSCATLRCQSIPEKGNHASAHTRMMKLDSEELDSQQPEK